MDQHIIRLSPLGKELTVNHNTPMMDVLHGFGIEFPCGGKGTCGKCKIKILAGHLEMTAPHREKILKLGLDDSWRLACLSRATEDVTIQVAQFEALILADDTKFDFIPQNGYGIAVDVGTTTLVAQLVDLTTASVLAVETMLNPQVKYGADLISRIQKDLEGHGAQMTDLIQNAIGGMLEKLMAQQPVNVKRVVLVGNTAMQRTFVGLSLNPLSCYPFQVADLGAKTFPVNDLGWKIDVEEPVCFYPSIGSFVGSDILAGIAATGIHRHEKMTALIDLGTNGEIVLGNRHGMVCASTAAGPAFEGANISMGMRAVTGAISSITTDQTPWSLQVIGNEKARGICGSGLIDAMAIFREQELIGSFGDITTGEESISLDEVVVLTQKDINEFQLAKAALAAGLTILASELSITTAEIDEIVIAGAFGNYIHIGNMVATGMVEAQEEKIHKMGNTALIGAKMFLFSGPGLADEICTKIRHVNLEANRDFQDIYVDKMLFP
jgi:uncharacterized 2Fe-2S/4Fe-4S cluster protein (DUF4445 family)